MGEAARKGLQRGEHMFMLDLVMTATFTEYLLHARHFAHPAL